MSDENAAPGLRGETKFFFEDKTIDAVLAMVMTLGCEISALSEKLETVIDLLEARGVAGAADVAGFAPSEAQQARRDAARKILIESLLAPFQRDADDLARRDG